MTPWYDIYKERMNEGYHTFMKQKYGPFIDDILSSNGYHFIELGCGAGNITKALRENSRYRSFTMVDNCPKMLSLAVENNPTDKCMFICADITKSQNIPWTGVDTVIHSHGVLEHFDDETIRRIIKLAHNYSPIQFHYVPGSKYETPSRGDERLLTLDQWNRILGDEPFSFDLSTFNDGFDIIIKTWRPR